MIMIYKRSHQIFRDESFDFPRFERSCLKENVIDDFYDLFLFDTTTQHFES